MEVPRPRTARDKLGLTRLGEVDGVVVVNELDGVRPAPARCCPDKQRCIEVVARMVNVLLGQVSGDQNFVV